MLNNRAQQALPWKGSLFRKKEGLRYLLADPGPRRGIFIHLPGKAPDGNVAKSLVSFLPGCWKLLFNGDSVGSLAMERLKSSLYRRCAWQTRLVHESSFYRRRPYVPMIQLFRRLRDHFFLEISKKMTANERVVEGSGKLWKSIHVQNEALKYEIWRNIAFYLTLRFPFARAYFSLPFFRSKKIFESCIMDVLRTWNSFSFLRWLRY